MARVCPDCGCDLRSEEILGIALDVCPTCAGIWFDDGELLKLKDLGEDALEEAEGLSQPEEADEKEAEPQAMAAASHRKCPACGSAMDEFSYLYTSKVKLDSCPACLGTWVDEGELKAMREALATARQHPENRQLMRTLEHQLKVIAETSAHKDLVERHRRVARFLRVFTMHRPQVD
jgi:Zn-finger nucleic acid-binding protein